MKACAICHGPLSEATRTEVELGAYTCPVCGLVLAVCERCASSGSPAVEALEKRANQHIESCEALKREQAAEQRRESW